MNLNDLTPDEMKIYEEENTYFTEMAAAIERLENNADFKKVIMEGYLKEYVLSQHSLLATPMVKRNGTRPEIMETLVATSNLISWMGMVKQFASSYADAVEEV